MARDSNGVYSLPPGLTAITGEDILPEQINTPFSDIATALTGSMPRNGAAAMTANLPMGGFKVTGSADASASTDLVPKGQMDTAIAGALLPAGVVVPYASASVPSGWLLCNGQAVSRATYAALFAVVATTFGTGDGSTTFNVPELRGEFIRGLDNARGVDTGRVLGSAQASGIAAHNHTATSVVTDPGHTHTTSFGAGVVGTSSGGNLAANTSGSPATGSNTTGITVATTVNNSTGTETRPRNVAFPFIIKT